VTTDSAMLTERNQPAACPASGQVTVLRDKWNEHAKEWIAWVRSPEEPDSYTRFHRERFLGLVPEPGRLTLDIGCGEGRVGRDLQASGHTVLGVDWSRVMCEAAASHPSAPIPVVVGDAANLPLADASVDCVVAFMSLQDIDDMRAAVTEIARVLEDGKKVALAIVHPMYSGGRFNAADGPEKEFVIRRSYFKPEVCVSRDSQGSLSVTFYREHRPLQTYVKALLDASFIIEELHEVTDDDEGTPWHQVPMFLDVVATRKPRKAGNSPEEQEAVPHSRRTSMKRFGRDRPRNTRRPESGLKKGSARERTTKSTHFMRTPSGNLLAWSGTVLGLIVVVATAVVYTVY
jgi:SAM-dependent methyltransferase